MTSTRRSRRFPIGSWHTYHLPCGSARNGFIWVDITNLPHVLFFEDFIKTHDTLVTTRKFGELTELLDSHGIDYIAAGKHAANARQKLIQSSKRVAALAEIVSKEKIQAAVSKQSVELPRAAFGLGIPVIQVIDNEYAEHQNRLVLPLCSRLIVPEALDSRRLIKQGANRSQIETFNGLCEGVQVRRFKPKREILDNLDEYILIRPEPYFASYFKGRNITQKLIVELDAKIVVIPRGNEKFKNALMLKNVDSLNLIYHAKAFLGGGGTMNREAALLGTPTISYYPQELLGVDRFLIRQGLMQHILNPKEISRALPGLVEKKQELRKKAKSLVRGIENPFDIIEKEISSLGAGY